MPKTKENENNEKKKDEYVENTTRNPSLIRNKFKRAEVMVNFRKEKKALKKENRKKRKLESQEVGNDAPKTILPRTLENTREKEVTTVLAEDSEVTGDLADDEFAKIFNSEEIPKLMITTCEASLSVELYQFISELMEMIPRLFYYKRRNFTIKDICKFASNKEFTHLIIISERENNCNGAYITRLPVGPTAFFKVSNVTLGNIIPNKGKRTSHTPEIILNNFTTRLGYRVGRFLGSLFPHNPEFRGRQVVTFHNQRDFIFVRQHRYVFENNKKANLQEIGPRFTLRLRWLQEGTFDTKFGEYEWYHHRKQMDTSRRKFHL